MPAFWEFWDTTIEESTDKRVRGFFNTVVAAYPDLFHHGLIASGALTDLGSVPEAQARVAKYLQDLRPFIPAMRKIRMIAPRVAPMVRRTAMSAPLSFTSM